VASTFAIASPAGVVCAILGGRTMPEASTTPTCLDCCYGRSYLSRREALEAVGLAE
jgi:hypothetical protein